MPNAQVQVAGVADQRPGMPAGSLQRDQSILRALTCHHLNAHSIAFQLRESGHQSGHSSVGAPGLAAIEQRSQLHFKGWTWRERKRNRHVIVKPALF